MDDLFRLEDSVGKANDSLDVEVVIRVVVASGRVSIYEFHDDFEEGRIGVGGHGG